MKKILIRFLISFILLLFMLLLINSLIYDKNKNYDDDWTIEDTNIINMCKDKLKASNWFEKPAIWLHKNETFLPKKDGVKRILIVGDSVVWGYGYSNANHIWWQQLKELLKKNGYDNVEVVAAGISGYSTFQQLEHILKDEETIKLADPDLIVCTYVLNDMESIENTIKVINDDEYFLFGNSSNIIDEFLDKNLSEIYNRLKRKLNLHSKDSNSQELDYIDWVDTIGSMKSLRAYEYDVICNLKYYMENILQVPYLFLETNNIKPPAIR